MYKKSCLAIAVFCLTMCVVYSADGRALVGAIRWDDWHSKPDHESPHYWQYLEPEQWHYRHPFFTKLDICRLVLRCDTQEATDQEIAYAKEAGLDYWAYGYYFPGGWAGADGYNYALYKYLSSEQRNDINFCLRLGGGPSAGADPNDWYNWMIPTLVDFFKESSYQTVAGGRPLLYIFGVDDFTSTFGSSAAAGQALNDLRTAATTAGCGSPYIACMVWHASDGANYVNDVGYDAISAYTHLDWSAGVQEYPYSALAAENASFWDECKATGKQVVPIVNIGWDYRPHTGVNGDRALSTWYAEPTMTEWKNHLQAALDWVDENPNATEPNAVIIYAWNELTEGGWMVPTRGDGTARVEATGEVLNE
jgi:hypothetical protein